MLSSTRIRLERPTYVQPNCSTDGRSVPAYQDYLVSFKHLEQNWLLSFRLSRAAIRTRGYSRGFSIYNWRHFITRQLFSLFMQLKLIRWQIKIVYQGNAGRMLAKCEIKLVYKALCCLLLRCEPLCKRFQEKSRSNWQISISCPCGQVNGKIPNVSF